jgi:hypothetical protein
MIIRQSSWSNAIKLGEYLKLSKESIIELAHLIEEDVYRL